jgi:hypothetical protein
VTIEPEATSGPVNDPTGNPYPPGTPNGPQPPPVPATKQPVKWGDDGWPGENEGKKEKP